MTRHPVSDTRSVVRRHANAANVERFFTSDLAKYLRVSVRQLQKLARERRIDRYVYIQVKPQLKAEWMWVDRRGARGLIEHYRAMQGAMLAEGKDWDEEREKRLGYSRRKNLRKV
jgi:hypothetical protein